MHPEVHSDGPGICPDCGMALESADPTIEDDGELKSMQRRLVAALLLGLPVLVLAMGGMFFSGIPSSPPAQALLSLAVVFGAGWPLMRRGWDSLRSGKPNMFALIAIGATVAVAPGSKTT